MSNLHGHIGASSTRGRLLRTSIALLGAFLALGGMPLASIGKAAHVAGATRLRGVTTFVARRPGSANVYLPKDVDVTPQGSGVDKQPPYDFTGNGRLIAVFITQFDDDTPLGDGASLLAWSDRRCLKKGCKARGFLFNNAITFGPLERRHGKVYLPMGDYKVFYVADGARTKFRMELRGLKGKTTIRPRGAMTSRLKSLRPSSETVGDEQTYYGGRSTNLSGRGLTLLGFWMVGEAETVRGEAGYCVYDERPDDAMSFMPPCPLADDSQTFPQNAGSTEFTRYNGPGLTIEQGLGAHYTTPTTLKKAGGVTLWIDFSPDD